MLGAQVSDVVFGYFTQIAADGSTEGVLLITSASDFSGSSQLKIFLQGGISAPTITDRTGLRSSLLDFNQDGTRDASGDPFGTTLASTQNFLVGAPNNDNFDSAYVITSLPASLTGNNIGATNEVGEPNNAGVSGGSSVWWTWTAPSSGLVTINTEGSDFDTTLGVYTGTFVIALTEITSNDDVNFPSDLASSVTFNAVAGTTYHISVDGFSGVGFGSGGATGNITLNVTM